MRGFVGNALKSPKDIFDWFQKNTNSMGGTTNSIGCKIQKCVLLFAFYDLQGLAFKALQQEQVHNPNDHGTL